MLAHQYSRSMNILLNIGSSLGTCGQQPLPPHDSNVPSCIYSLYGIKVYDIYTISVLTYLGTTPITTWCQKTYSTSTFNHDFVLFCHFGWILWPGFCGRRIQVDLQSLDTMTRLTTLRLFLTVERNEEFPDTYPLGFTILIHIKT